MIPTFNLFLIENTIKTESFFYINWDKTRIEDVRIFIDKDGYGIEHELVEMDLVINTLKTEPEIAEYDWDICCTIFHYITGLCVQIKNICIEKKIGKDGRLYLLAKPS